MSELSGIVGFAVVLALISLRVPVAIAMGVVGAVGSVALSGWSATSYLLGNLAFEAVFPYGLSVVPLFIFMGVFAAHAGLSRNLYECVYALVGHWRGGLAMATVGACAGFGAICGSSLATCATMGKVALPEMQRHRYDRGLAAASIAAGGTLGVLIPPSIILVIYALITEQSIGALFSAALLPGLLATALYMLAVAVQTWRHPELGPKGSRLDWSGKLRSLVRVWDVALLFLVVIGGIYLGVFSPTEAAAIGAGGALVLTAVKGRLTKDTLLDGITETAQMTGMIFMILIGAAIFNFFIEESQLPQELVRLIADAGFSALGVLVLLVVFYIVLGCFMDSLSMILLTLPSVFGVVLTFGMDPIWFGVLLVTVVEIGLITPPIGMNLFVLKALSPELRLGDLYRGVVPFIAADMVRIVILIALPGITLWLPRLLGLV